MAGAHPPDPYTSGSVAHSRKTASHATTDAVAATAGDAYHIGNNETGGVRAAAKAASANGTVLTAAAGSTGEVDAHAATVGDSGNHPRLHHKLLGHLRRHLQHCHRSRC